MKTRTVLSNLPPKNDSDVIPKSVNPIAQRLQTRFRKIKAAKQQIQKAKQSISSSFVHCIILDDPKISVISTGDCFHVCKMPRSSSCKHASTSVDSSFVFTSGRNPIKASRIEIIR